MAQTGTSNYPIPNDTGANFRADVNENLTDLYSNSSGSSAPPAAIDNQLWIDTSTTPDTLKVKQGGSWISLLTIETNGGLAPAASPAFSSSLNLPAGSSGSLPLRVTGDTDTGLYFATNEVNIQAGNTLSHRFTATASSPKVPTHATNGSASSPSYTFASDTNTGLFRAGADRLGVSISGAHDFEFSASELEVRNGNSLRLNDNDNSNHLKLTAPSNLSSNYTLTLPANDGSNNEILKTDGSGNTSWTAVSSLISDVSGGQMHVITSSQTFTPASGRTSFLVMCTGGGGASGSQNTNTDDSNRIGRSGQGGSGGTAIRFYNSTEFGSNASITVGLGGSAPNWANSGPAGGNSSCNPAGSGTTVTGNGGGGSPYANEWTGSGAGGSAGTCSSHQLGFDGTAGKSGGSSGYTSANKAFWTAMTYGQGAPGRQGGSNQPGYAGSNGVVVVFEW